MEYSSGHEDKEADRSLEQAIDDGGATRYYECVFCKQGFTTAQALGGHMNIHRRERARNRQPTLPAVTTQPLEDYFRAAHSRPTSTHLPRYFQAQETPSNYHMYLPPSPSSSSHPHLSHNNQSKRSLRLFEEDHYTNLGLQIGSKDNQTLQYGGQDEVDLELRLGHDP
ncbi:hypothetical protein FRX31_034878 [Thalictrum thalictroides]|uniref:C2H2-type domain-containing protein n=1 Tax=Thalictrum thalictroides TaxID=46969 RepID=A0A7J6UTQ6_THATH|nr:hypothetical protein FRX31_034878 [Thalictrum thalictroides]